MGEYTPSEAICKEKKTPASRCCLVMGRVARWWARCQGAPAGKEWCGRLAVTHRDDGTGALPGGGLAQCGLEAPAVDGPEVALGAGPHEARLSLGAAARAVATFDGRARLKHHIDVLAGRVPIETNASVRLIGEAVSVAAEGEGVHLVEGFATPAVHPRAGRSEAVASERALPRALEVDHGLLVLVVFDLVRGPPAGDRTDRAAHGAVAGAPAADACDAEPHGSEQRDDF